MSFLDVCVHEDKLPKSLNVPLLSCSTIILFHPFFFKYLRTNKIVKVTNLSLKHGNTLKSPFPINRGIFSMIL